MKIAKPVAIAELCPYVHRMASLGLLPATSGNFGVRCDSDIWVTRSGIDKSSLAEHDFVLLDSTYEEGSSPSAEAELHHHIFQSNETIGCVLHIHSAEAVAVSRQNKGTHVSFAEYEILKAFSGVDTHHVTLDCHIADNSQNMTHIIENLPDINTLDCPAFLIRGHGLYVWGATVADAWRHLEALQHLLHCWLLERM